MILALQALVFAIGAWRGPRQHPYGLIFQCLVAPRLGPVTEKEPVPPLRFAQLVGFVFAVGDHPATVIAALRSAGVALRFTIAPLL